MTKKDVVQAAFRVWSGAFYQKTSLSDVASELEVTKSAIYRHFKSKEALLEAMYSSYFDRFIDCVRPALDRARSAAISLNERLLLLSRAFGEYFIRNPHDLFFSLIKVWGNEDKTNNFSEQLKAHGLDFMNFFPLKDGAYPSKLQLIMCTIINVISHFLKDDSAECVFEIRKDFTDDEINNALIKLEKKIKYGLGFKNSKIKNIDWTTLEKSVVWVATKSDCEALGDDLLQAVASAVAEAGPWAASMNMVAKKSGLSKSSLYSHFESKFDMLHSLFVGEAERIIRHAQACSLQSNCPYEQLFLTIVGIGTYLKGRPQILIAFDSLRTRRLEDRDKFIFSKEKMMQHKHDQDKAYQIFSHIKDDNNNVLLKREDTDWILFMIVNTLMRRPANMNYADIPNESFRILYRFITLGLEGENNE